MVLNCFSAAMLFSRTYENTQRWLIISVTEIVIHIYISICRCLYIYIYTYVYTHIHIYMHIEECNSMYIHFECHLMRQWLKKG